MKKLYKIPFQILGYKLYRTLGWPKILPLSLVLSVTNKCNSRCKTCNLWKTSYLKKELTVEEWEKIFERLDNSVVWLTFSGGDQFLRTDFYEIVNLATDIAKPRLINIPLSNRNADKTVKQITKILKHSKVPLMINLSLDGTEQMHNFLRGRNNSFQSTIETFQQLKKLKKDFSQLFVCFNTVVSRHNISSLKNIRDLILELKPDYWMLEPVQCRVEFNNLKENVCLNYPDLFQKIKNFNYKSTSKKILSVKHMIRNVYYHFAEKTLLENKVVIPCYAAIASVQISPEGYVWQCGTKGDVLGNLRESDYEFKKIFFSKKADMIRKRIKEDKCFCIQCNSLYTSLMCNPSTFAEYLSNKTLRPEC
jgi:MoaA/NifB/PqqE/SkfB family radical SAM enzyme